MRGRFLPSIADGEAARRPVPTRGNSSWARQPVCLPPALRPGDHYTDDFREARSNMKLAMRLVAAICR
jgi:hypothetical protein